MNECKKENDLFKIIFPNKRSVIITSCVIALMVIVTIVAVIVSNRNNNKSLDRYKMDLESLQGLIDTSIDPAVIALSERNLSPEEREMLYGQYKVVFENVGLDVKSSKGLGGDIKIAKSKINGTGLFYNYTTKNGIFMQLIMLKGPDGKIRVGLNTSDDCKGYADSYFERGYGIFKCKHCGSVIADGEVGLGVNSAAPVKVAYKNGFINILISEETLLDLEGYFTNWNGPRNE